MPSALAPMTIYAAVFLIFSAPVGFSNGIMNNVKANVCF